MTNTTTRTTLKAVLVAFALTALPLAVSPVKAYATTTLSVDGDASTVKANLKMARRLMSKSGTDRQKSKNYDAAKTYLENVLAIDPENSEAKEMLAQYYTYRAERRLANKRYDDAKTDVQQAIELNPSDEAQSLLANINEAIRQQEEAWATACADGSSEALDAFKNAYPRSSHVNEIANRKTDYKYWDAACTTNTKASYQQYLADSKHLFYKDEAEKRILNFQMEEDWLAVKDAKDYAQLEAFAKKYPESAYAAEATHTSILLQAREKYAAGNHDAAYTLYSKAGMSKSLTGEDLENYNYITAERENKRILQSDDLTAVQNYLTSMESSSNFYRDFYDNASDHYALLLAHQLSRTSSDAEMEAPARYAKSASTKSAVDGYVSSAKAQRRAYNRKQWWRQNCHVGILTDFELNSSDEGGAEIAELNNFSVGLGVRFGGHRDLLGALIGVKYKVFGCDLFSTDENDDSEFETLCRAVAIPAELRINLVHWGESSSFFIGCGGEYGFIVSNEVGDECTESSYLSVSPMLGYRSRHFDISLYYKTFVNPPFKTFQYNRNETGNSEYKSFLGFNLQFWF